MQGSAIAFGSVEVAGFRAETQTGRAWSGLTWHDGSTPWLLGRASDYNDDPGGTYLSLTNLATGASVTLPSFGLGDRFGAAATFRPGEAVLTEGDSSVVCLLPPVPGTCVRSRPPERDPRAVWVSDSVWISRDVHWITVRHYDGPTVTVRVFPLGWANRVLIAPGVGRVAFEHGKSPTNGIDATLVLDSRTGDTAYSIPRYGAVFGAAFTPDEARLVLAAGPGSSLGLNYPDTLLVVDAVTGTRLAARALPGSFMAGAIAMDPAAPLAYITGVDSTQHPRVLILDLATYAWVGAPRARALAHLPWSTSAIVDRNRGTLHAIEPYTSDFQFELLPVP